MPETIKVQVRVGKNKIILSSPNPEEVKALFKSWYGKCEGNMVGVLECPPNMELELIKVKEPKK